VTKSEEVKPKEPKQSSRRIPLRRRKERKVALATKENCMYRAFTSCTNEGTVVVWTVEENINGFTKREVEHAKLARQLHIRLGYPSVSDILGDIKNGRILNSQF